MLNAVSELHFRILLTQFLVLNNSTFSHINSLNHHMKAIRMVTFTSKTYYPLNAQSVVPLSR